MPRRETQLKKRNREIIVTLIKPPAPILNSNSALVFYAKEVEVYSGESFKVSQLRDGTTVQEYYPFKCCSFRFLKGKISQYEITLPKWLADERKIFSRCIAK